MSENNFIGLCLAICTSIIMGIAFVTQFAGCEQKAKSPPPPLRMEVIHNGEFGYRWVWFVLRDNDSNSEYILVDGGTNRTFFRKLDPPKVEKEK